MPEANEEDVKDELDASTDSDTDTKDEEIETKDVEDDLGLDDDEDLKDESEESKDSDGKKEDAPDYKALYEKSEEKAKNLTQALREKRSKDRQSISPTVAQPQADNAQIKVDPVTQTLVTRNEKAALTEMYEEFPELRPENDTDDTLYNEVVADMAIMSRSEGLPIMKEDFTKMIRHSMKLRGYGKEAEKAKVEGRTEAHKEQMKREAANIGGTSGATQPEKQIVATEADRRAARAAGMDLKSYMKNKDVYGDEVPL